GVGVGVGSAAMTRPVAVSAPVHAPRTNEFGSAPSSSAAPNATRFSPAPSSPTVLHPTASDLSGSEPAASDQSVSASATRTYMAPATSIAPPQTAPVRPPVAAPVGRPDPIPRPNLPAGRNLTPAESGYRPAVPTTKSTGGRALRRRVALPKRLTRGHVTSSRSIASFSAAPNQPAGSRGTALTASANPARGSAAQNGTSAFVIAPPPVSIHGGRRPGGAAPPVPEVARKPAGAAQSPGSGSGSGSATPTDTRSLIESTAQLFRTTAGHSGSGPGSRPGTEPSPPTADSPYGSSSGSPYNFEGTHMPQDIQRLPSGLSKYPGEQVIRRFSGGPDGGADVGLTPAPSTRISPRDMEDLVDEVVQRIEQRVVDELERRGRRQRSGGF
ncbi:MAG: hypothetical protein JWM76_2014, partial [Pseudonocardiales bacterium]|nr:hypothetical protein [Pseudonocardiales bacterium]